MKKKLTFIEKNNLEKKVLEQFNESIELGYFTKEEVDNYLKSKKKKLKKKKNLPKVKKPIIYYGFNTISK
jgi:hypothetical protein